MFVLYCIVFVLYCVVFVERIHICIHRPIHYIHPMLSSSVSQSDRFYHIHIPVTSDQCKNYVICHREKHIKHSLALIRMTSLRKEASQFLGKTLSLSQIVSSWFQEHFALQVLSHRRISSCPVSHPKSPCEYQ